MAQRGFRRKPHGFRNPKTLLFNARAAQALEDDENAPEPPPWAWDENPEQMDGDDE